MPCLGLLFRWVCHPCRGFTSAVFGVACFLLALLLHAKRKGSRILAKKTYQSAVSRQRIMLGGVVAVECVVAGTPKCYDGLQLRTACCGLQNFLALCASGYYDNTIFHRSVSCEKRLIFCARFRSKNRGTSCVFRNRAL